MGMIGSMGPRRMPVQPMMMPWANAPAPQAPDALAQLQQFQQQQQPQAQMPPAAPQAQTPSFLGQTPASLAGQIQMPGAGQITGSAPMTLGGVNMGATANPLSSISAIAPSASAVAAGGPSMLMKLLSMFGV